MFRPGPLNPFRHRDYALYWGARFCAVLGTQAQAVTLGWQVYEVARGTRSVPEAALLVGMIGLAQFVPLFLLTLPAGEVADRRDRRWCRAAPGLAHRFGSPRPCGHG